MIELKVWGGRTVGFLAEPCSHEAVEPVASVVDGALLAWLCIDCDAQLPAAWRSVTASG